MKRSGEIVMTTVRVEISMSTRKFPAYMQLVEVSSEYLISRIPMGTRVKMEFGESEIIANRTNFVLHTMKGNRNVIYLLRDGMELKLLYTEHANGMREFVDLIPREVVNVY